MLARRVVSGAVRASALALLLASCNGVLGWDQASVDPILANPEPDGGHSINTTTSGISCPAYCDLIMAGCGGPNAEYGSRDVCLSMCEHIEPGFIGETQTNTLACRQHYAAAAANDPAGNCRKAGPLGGGVCGTNPCDSYCLLDIALCGTRAFATPAACRTECGSFRFVQTVGTITEQSGNTLNCRIYHLEQAYGVSLEAHCPHTGVESATCF